MGLTKKFKVRPLSPQQLWMVPMNTERWQARIWLGKLSVTLQTGNVTHTQGKDTL